MIRVGIVGLLLVNPLLIPMLTIAQTSAPAVMRGIPGAHNVDHVGLTVPDLDQAVRFFVDVLAQKTSSALAKAPAPKTPPIFKPHLMLIRAPRSGFGCCDWLNLELMEYKTVGQNRNIPKNSDVDAPHIAFFVDDIEVATAYLTSHGCKMLAGPLKSSSGPKAGQAIRYFETPWGLAMDIESSRTHAVRGADLIAVRSGFVVDIA